MPIDGRAAATRACVHYVSPYFTRAAASPGGLRRPGAWRLVVTWAVAWRVVVTWAVAWRVVVTWAVARKAVRDMSPATL
jgi:hypothetical protein